jgi:hypothetical protein
MNRRQFLTGIPMIGAAIVAAPAVAAAMAVKPEFAMGGTLTPGTPYIVGESVSDAFMTPDQIREFEREFEDAWQQRHTGIPASSAYYPKFNPAALLRGDAQPHQA